MMETTNYNRLLNNLEELNLTCIKDNLPLYADMASRGEKGFIDTLYELSEKEKSFRRERLMNNSVKTAGFPYRKKFEDYDFSFQPSVKKEEIADLMSLRFVEEKENIIFVGSPGTGKTHLATSLGIEAAMHRYGVRFVTCQRLLLDFMQAIDENRLEKKMKQYAGYKVLIIDEIGYINMDTTQANLFFQLISRRYERKSTILTTNKTLSKWADIFTDPIITNAILDRLLHHCHVINIIGPSYRTKDIIASLEDKQQTNH